MVKVSKESVVLLFLQAIEYASRSPNKHIQSDVEARDHSDFAAPSSGRSLNEHQHHRTGHPYPHKPSPIHFCRVICVTIPAAVCERG